MSDQAPCCRELTHPRTHKSPFSRIIALDWYDGPRAGFLQCGCCAREFRCELLEELINDEHEQDLRIFSLAPLAPGALTRWSDALSRYETPALPVWVPRWEFPTEAEHIALDRLTDQIRAEAGAPKLANATPNLSQEIVVAKAITAGDLAQVTDWFAFLGLVGKVAEPPPHRATR